ncbi:MAG: 16S rRNA processing protein RimM, partial [Ktedonobacteraceae bacterium]|nr:16S rRNA processing protein RimM [Ktedonobacteraceae bacterium]
MPRQEKTTEWATIGKIVAPFGIRGEVKIFSLSDVPDRFTKLKDVYLSPDYRRYGLERVRPYKGEMLLLKIEGIDDATGAESLRNRDLCIPSSELSQLPPDSYYQHDILNLRVARLNDETVGTIKDIIVTAGNDVYVVEASDGKQIFIPAIKEVVKQVDL